MVLLISGVILTALLIAGSIFGFPYLFNKEEDPIEVNFANKKAKSADLTSYRLSFSAVGLFCSLLLIWGVLDVFATRILPNPADQFSLERFEEELEEIPNTFIPPPPPPKIVQPEPVEVPDEEEIIEQEIVFEEDSLIEPEPDLDLDIFSDEPIIEEVVDAKIWNLDEISIKPQYPGGIKNFYKMIINNYDYPEADRRLGTEGIIYVKFVIDADGKLINASILRGVNDRMNKEILRVLKLSPKWVPGKFADKNVPVSYRIPIRLTAND